MGSVSLLYSIYYFVCTPNIHGEGNFKMRKHSNAKALAFSNESSFIYVIQTKAGDPLGS